MGNRLIKKKQTLQAIVWLVLSIAIIGLVIGLAKKLTEPSVAPISQEVLETEVLETEVLETEVPEAELIEASEFPGDTALSAEKEEFEQDKAKQDSEEIRYLSPEEVAQASKGVNLSEIPPYDGEAFVVIHDNIPYFTEGEMSTTAYEYYSPLDELGRCGVCVASVGLDVLPTEDRGSIGSVKPTGWINNKYSGVVDGSYLYNRCHLIGFQLTGENANKQNLITGTRYINVEGMLPFENMVADFVKETGYHVMYRITPIFDGDNLLASGVLMEAKSVEDDGEGILFNVYCYNVQPGIGLDYETGDNWLEE